MKPREIMVIAGETSGDILAAELVRALRLEFTAAEMVYSPDSQPLKTGLAPRFFGAGGPRMKAAGVELAFDMTEHTVIGLWDALKNYPTFRRLFDQLVRLAIEREPDAILCVDFSGFNRRFAHAIKEYTRRRHDWFHDWQPKIIQYVSPQVWASRASRAYQLARDYDLLLSIFPFEKEWYAKRVPRLQVEFVGHPIIDRFANGDLGLTRHSATVTPPNASIVNRRSQILLLPGSRSSELERHSPVMLAAFERMRRELPHLRAQMVLPDERLAQHARLLVGPEVSVQTEGLREALARADLAIASTGTVTMECAYFGVPTVTLYKASWLNYNVAKQMVKVKWLTMPNLLAEEEIFPEFIQGAATPDNLSRAALGMLQDGPRREHVKARLAQILGELGPPGANRRAARAIVRLLANSIPPAA